MDPTAQPDYSTVTAQPAAPIQTQDATSDQTIPQQPAPPAPQTTPTPAQQAPPPAPRPMFARLLDAVGDILSGGGRGPQQVSVDENGNRTTQPGAPMSTGQKFAKVGLEALTGAARTLQAGTGPQNQVRGVGNAISGAVSDQQKQNDQANDQADQDFQRKQQAKIQNLNYQILSRKLAADTITQQQQGVKANQEQIDFSNRQVDREKQLGSYDLGFVAHAGDIADLGAKTPGFIDKLHAGLVVPVPIYDADGNTKGLQVYLRKPETNAQPFSGQIHQYTPGEKPGDPPKYTMFTPTNMTVGEATNADMHAAGEYNEYVTAQQKAKEDAAKLKLTGAQTAEAYAAANKNVHETALLDNANSTAQIQSNAQQLVDGTMDPANMSKRSKSYDATLTAANALSIAQSGKPFDVAKAAGDYKFATNPQTYNTLNFLNSLIGRDGKGGNLGNVVQQSKTVGLTQLPALNDVEQWAKLSAGKPEVAAYRAALVETSDQVAKILQGGGSGSGTSDAKLKQAGEILNKSFNPKQIAAVAGTLQTLLGNRKTEMIGDNRYLQRWHNPQPAAGQPGQGGQPQAPAGATAEVKNAQGVVTGHVVNGQYVALPAAQAATATGR
jgi:hypothetical protein